MVATQASGELHGHCACGALRYTIDVSNMAQDLALSAFCHCARCQRLNGAPFVWSTHWLYRAVAWMPRAAAPPPGAPDAEEGAGAFSPAMSTFETMKGRKWKLRCSTCGSPLGSWNAAKHKWTIWPSTLARRPASRDGQSGVLADGEFDVPAHTLDAIKPTHHQFYGPWRSKSVRDGLEKWTGYRNESQQVTDDGEPLQR